MEFLHHPERSLRHFFAAPFIYATFLPLAILDLGIEIYHRVCFPLYGLPCVKRSRYIKMDRGRLSYLNFLEKFNCIYCSYANGLLHYASAIAAETEKYWCGIKHADDPDFIPPEHHKDFLPYGDAEALKRYAARK